MDLNRILLVFNVCSVISIRRSVLALTVHLQTELALNIYGTVSDVRDGVTKTHTAVVDTHSVVSEVQRDVADTHVVVADTHTMVSDIRRQMLGSQEEADDQHRSVSDTRTHTHHRISAYHCPESTQVGRLDCYWAQRLIFPYSISGESPPPAPRACFGRGELIEKIVGLASDLTPIALIGAGGIGKTSIALTVLHHDRIKQRFGVNRRFIRCDLFPPSCTNFLSRLSKVIGAGTENPGDLTFLRPFLSSREILIILDNAESILDPEGPDAGEIYSVVEELSQLDNICLCITSRISAIPSDCEALDIQTLSIDAARDAFYRIYKDDERSDLVDDILGQLDFHPLSTTLLATVAHQNKWGTERLTREWERQRTGMLQTIHNKSFAATIELFLTSPMFQELGPDGRALLEVVAFFPQGVDENNLNWLFPAIPNVTAIFDKLCVLSLTYRSNSFITMLAPLRDHLYPKDPKSSRLLRMAKDRYFTRVSVDTDPNKPGFAESRWIVSEDVNVEHLLDVFTTIDANSVNVWDACADFIRHLAHHKPRFIILGSKIEGLPDYHRSKPKCLFQLSRLSNTVGNHVERKRLLTHALRLWRERGNDRAVARTLCRLSDANRLLDLHKEGIQLVEEASEIFERLGNRVGQARCSMNLARLLYADSQLDAAGEAAFRAIDPLSEKGERNLVCELHCLLGQIYRSKGDREKVSNHLEIARRIASSFNWHQQLFRIHCDLARLSLDEGGFDDAQAHVERAKLHTLNHTYFLGHAMKLQAELWRGQGRLEEARSEALRAAEVYEKLGATKDLKKCSGLLRQIEEETNEPVISSEPADDGEFPV